MEIKKPEFCPDWFDINIYDDVLPSLDRENLAMCIFTRQMQYKGNLDKEYKHSERVKGYDENFIIMMATEWLKIFKKRSQIKTKEETDPQYADVISELKLFDVVWLYADCYLKRPILREYLKNNLPAYLEELLEIGGNEMGIAPNDILEKNNENYQLITDELDNSANVLNYSTMFHVDTNYSDEVILQEFKIKLSEIRAKENDRGKRLTDIEISKLIEFKVLPYMDLYLWQTVTETNLTYAQIADLLYPLETREPNFDAVDRISRVTHKRAMQLFHTHHNKFL